jgi:perosamine synthetase
MPSIGTSDFVRGRGNDVKPLIPISQPSISELEVSYVTDAVRSGWVSSLGSYIKEFERSFAEYCGTERAVSVSNGTTGLHLALLAVDVGPGDEVIIPDLTFVATANAVAYTGAKPVMVDIDPETLCIDPKAVQGAISSRTRVIMPVHLYGHPADMDPINEIARKHDLIVIEDAAEAHGAEYKGKRAGSLARCGVFSFYGNKIITTGEGGMITTDDAGLCRKAERLRDHAMNPSKRYWHDEIGYNYRMTNLQAALGVAQLKRIDEFSARRREIMEWYRAGLGNHSHVKLNRKAVWAAHAYWMVCLEVEGMSQASRDSFITDLRSRGVDARPYFYPVSDMPMYPKSDTPISHRISACGINLPSFVGLRREQVDYICAVVKDLTRR